MTRHSLVLCKSVHHHNTRAVADAIANVLHAEVVDPDEVMLPTAGDLALLGIGSGIYYARFHRSIRDWLKGLPENAGCGHRAFVYSTSGLPFLSRFYHHPITNLLRNKGFEVVGEFACRGHDTFGPLWLIGGLNRRHPSENDLENAKQFAESLCHATKS